MRDFILTVPEYIVQFLTGLFKFFQFCFSVFTVYINK